MSKQQEYPFKIRKDLSSTKLVVTMPVPTLADDGTSYLGEVRGDIPLEILEVMVPYHPEVIKAREEKNKELTNLVNKLKRHISFYEERRK